MSMFHTRETLYQQLHDDRAEAADRIEALGAENARLRDALAEARCYVPDHHGPVVNKINAALWKAKP
jgi:hypothetical protein